MHKKHSQSTKLDNLAEILTQQNEEGIGMNRCLQEPPIFGSDGERNMSEDIMAEAMELFRSGDLKGAVENLDGKLRSNRDNAILQYTYAEFANMLNMEEQDDVVPGTKIMMSQESNGIDEENDEAIVDFASFALECRRTSSSQGISTIQPSSRDGRYSNG